MILRRRERGALAAALMMAAVSCAASPGGDDWKYDVVYLKSGAALKGLVVKDTPAEIVLRQVSRKPGVKTVVIVCTLGRKELDHVDRLDDKERELLKARLEALDPTGGGEVQRMTSLTLEKGDWGQNGKGQARIFKSEHFELESNGSEDVVRRVAVRLENVYAAYTRFLPPRQKSAAPTRVLLARSLADYQALLKEQGHASLVNPAFYDPKKNHICCGSELQRLGDELERIHKRHQQVLADLKDKEAELSTLYKGKVPAQLLKPIQDARRKIAQHDDKNEKVFQGATSRLFQRLYHEAFHAYLANFVYPTTEADVPRWLNEGLAQIFETAIVEADELRVGHLDKERVTRMRELLDNGQFVTLTDLLKSGPKQFLVVHATEKQTSDRYYLASWGLAYYLTFDRKLLGTKAMDEYVKTLHRGGNPLTAFRELVGQPLDQFEKDFRRYLSKLPTPRK
jgi:hypothetical protein